MQSVEVQISRSGRVADGEGGFREKFSSPGVTLLVEAEFHDAEGVMILDAIEDIRVGDLVRVLV